MKLVSRARQHLYLRWGLPVLSALLPVWLRRSGTYTATIQGVLWWASLGVLMVSISIQVDVDSINWWCAGGIVLSIALLLLRLSTVGVFSVLGDTAQVRMEALANARGWTLQACRHTNLDYSLVRRVTCEAAQVASRAVCLAARWRSEQGLEKPSGTRRPRL